LLKWASEIAQVDETVRPLLTESVLTGILSQIPDRWLVNPDENRRAYRAYFMSRLSGPPLFAEEALRARAAIV
jgi:hypothetical protein